MSKPTIFIGSSTEGESIAYAIQENLENIADVYVWTQGVFELGSSYIESLIKELDKADFAVLVLTEDDITISRSQQTVSPRDNVLFELGLFMGRLGKDRSFFVFDKTKNIKIPSDLSGISGAGYLLQQSGNLKASLGVASNQIRNAVLKSGIRARVKQENINAYFKKLAFCNKITGYWWERIKPDANSALSFVNIKYDEELLVLKLNGRTYDAKGNYIAYWESGSSGVHYVEKKVFYKWKGWFPSTPDEPFEGVGEIFFYGEEDSFTEANGIFSNINISDIKSIRNSSFELSRSNDSEVDIMYSKEKEKIAKLIVDKIQQMN